MRLETRLEKLEKLTPVYDNNPFADWTDEEIEMSIYLLGQQYRTGQKQEWPEELARKRAALPKLTSDLSDEELEAKIARLEQELNQQKTMK